MFDLQFGTALIVAGALSLFERLAVTGPAERNEEAINRLCQVIELSSRNIAHMQQAGGQLRAFIPSEPVIRMLPRSARNCNSYEQSCIKEALINLVLAKDNAACGEEFLAAIRASGVPQALISVLGLHSDDDSQYFYSCRNALHAVQFCMQGVPDGLMQAVQSLANEAHAGSEWKKMQFLEILISSKRNLETTGALVSAGAISFVVELAHTGTEEQRGKAVQALCRLAARESQAAFLCDGGIGVLVQLAASCRDGSTLTQVGGALIALASEPDKQRPTTARSPTPESKERAELAALRAAGAADALIKIACSGTGLEHFWSSRFSSDFQLHEGRSRWPHFGYQDYD